VDDGGGSPYYVKFRWDYDPLGADIDYFWTLNGREIDPIDGVAVVANTLGTTLHVDIEEE